MQFFLPMKPPTVTHHAKELRAFMKDGKPKAVLHDSAELKDARAKVHAALAPHRPAQPLQGAVRLLAWWCFPLEGTHRDGEYKTSRPDNDNLQKALKDCMTSLGFWKDDAQVASELVEKYWSAVPGIFIKITDLEAKSNVERT